MSYKGRYAQAKPSGGGWKKALIIVLCILLVIAGLVYAVWTIGLDTILGKITQAKYEDKGTTSELDLLAAGGKEIGNPDDPTEESTAATVPTEEVTVTSEPVEETTEPETTEEATEPDYGETGKIVNILLIGQDYRPGEEAHKLSDTIMLFTLNKETKKLTATSFLRDSYVNLPDYYRGHRCGWNRINTAYALGYGWFGDAGAMEMLNLTIQNNYGVEIDGDIEIGLETFEKIINIFGGLEINLVGDERTYMDGCVDNVLAEGMDPSLVHYFDEGVNLLNGREALWYARMRHANNADNDINRAGRQRIIVDKVLEKCKSMSIAQITEILDQVLPMIVTNISVEDMKLYIKELLPYIFDVELVSNQCPAEIDGSYWGEMVELPDGLSGVLKIDFNMNKKLMMELCEE